MQKLIEILGLIGAVGMPLWNIPLIIRIYRRKSSADISLGWLWGIWGCMVLMLPSSLKSPDIILRAFGTSNLAMFSVVVIIVLKYRKASAAKND